MLISTIKIQKNRHITKYFHLSCADLFMCPVYKGTFSVPSLKGGLFFAIKVKRFELTGFVMKKRVEIKTIQ